MIDPDFYKKVNQVQDPLTGTEIMAPILYYFIRSIRPQRLLEYGMGYSTFFILKALADNVAAFKKEKQRLIKKKYNEKLTISKENFYSFFFDKEAAFLNSEFYINDYQPKLICFEKLPAEHSYTTSIIQTIKALKLDNYLYIIHGNPCTQSDEIPASLLPLDFIWNDDDSYYKFFKTYWGLMNNHNSYLLYHSTEETTSLGMAELGKIKQSLVNRDDNEILSIIEPHKLHQSSFTIIRKKGKKEVLHFDIPSHQEKIYKNFLNFRQQFGNK